MFRIVHDCKNIFINIDCIHISYSTAHEHQFHLFIFILYETSKFA